jgi:2-oxoglutarate dehydrogenase E2 component (dihydrolipoamide succinyltransferase)
MAVDIKVPAVGESITEGTLSRWLKKDGDFVRADEPVFELETDKATGEIAAPVAGKLVIAVPEGQTVAIGAVVGRIEESAAPAREKRDGAGKPTPAAAASKEQPDLRARAGLSPKGSGEDNMAPKPERQPAAEATIPVSPAARHIAEDAGIDIRQLTGSGRGGRIIKEDVLAHLEQQPTEAPVKSAEPQTERAPGHAPRVTEPRRETRQRMSAIRQRIGERLIASQKATATLTTFNEADLSAVMALRTQYKERFREKHGVGLGFMSFFVKASVEALRAFPVANARIDDADIVYQHFYDIGVAVSTEKGLMVPILRDADRLSFADIEKRLGELAQKAREGKIAVADLQGGTFTITNGGVFGSLLSTPILNPPQSAILGMHAIQKRPVAVNDQVVIRPMMYLALSYDHRLIDGREAVQFLVRIKECVENPERLLLEI